MEDIDETNYVEAVLPQFTKETGIKVSIERITYEAMHDKLVPQLSAGKGKSEYDLIQVDVPWTKEFADAHWLLNLSDYLGKSTEVKLSEFIPSTVESNGIIDGEPYMVPFYHYAYGFLYRRDVLENDTLGKAFEKEYGSTWEVPTTLQAFERFAEFVSAREGRSNLAGTVMLAKREENGLSCHGCR
jgi:ABC-type glycerol-3-phosphate transport system substrate-binding protein